MASSINTEHSNMIIFLGDISGSMGSPSTNNDEGREYSRLDFVKQSLLFAIEAVPENTIFALATFESSGYSNIQPTKINSTNKPQLVNSIKRLGTRGGTNIMSGLLECKMMMDNVECDNKNIILLSDGEDSKLNINNIDMSMTESFGTEPNFKIDTVGYGPDANTQLLVRMASFCSGTYALCYDASMVGTIIGRAITRTYAGNQVYGIPDAPDSSTNDYHNYRELLSDILLNQKQFRQQNNDAISNIGIRLYDYLNQNTDQSSNKYYEYMLFMHGDIIGELLLATSDDTAWYKWGKAYWTTMGIALKNQYAPNFKDKSLQCFGTDDVKLEYERLSSIYNSLEMVPPSLHRGSAPVPMRYASLYNDASGACLHSSSILVSKDNQNLTCPDIIKMLTNDEEVWVTGYHNGDVTNVRIKNIIISPYTEKEFYKINDCLLTSNHPILHDNVWTHPQKIPGAPMIIYKEDYVFNIILDKINDERANAVMVNNEMCVCFGHGIRDGSDAEDPFWGTESVIDCFYKAYGDRSIIETTMINIRSNDTGFTVDLHFE